MMEKKVMLIALVLALVGTAFAAPAEPYRMIFLTSGTYTAEAPDISTYNQWMQDEADAAGIGMGSGLGDGDTSWFVVGSTNEVDARDNTGTNPFEDGAGVPVYLLDGTTLIAVDNADLWDGAILAKIDQTPFGSSNHNWVYSGSSRIGTASPSSEPGAGGAYFGALGSGAGNIQQGSGADPINQWICPVDGGWIGDDPSTSLPMYAISEIIPEPATMALLGFGGLTLMRRRRK